MNKLRFYFFHLMPYPHIPPASEIQSTWVSLSNKYYDPHRGHSLYTEYLDQLAAAEQFGFDAIAVNEHHANFYGTMPSPNIIAAEHSVVFSDESTDREYFTILIASHPSI